MIASYERLLIERYLLPGSGARVVVLVAAIGVAVVAIGVAALIVVMSVMNGARTKLAVQSASLNGHATISRAGGRLPDWPRLQALALAQPGVVSAVPTLEGPAMASLDGRLFPARIRGLRPGDMARDPVFVTDADGFSGSMPQRDGQIAIGRGLAERLGASVGSQMTIMHPTVGPDGSLSLDSVGHLVTGVVQTGLSDYDNSLVVMNMRAAQLTLHSGDAVSQINLTTNAPPDRAETLLSPLITKLRGHATIRTWRELNQTLFDALAVEKIGMYVILSMVVLVALFNILSSLIMLVRFKVRDIAILRTMGASRAAIARIFVAVGTAVGGLGTVLGCGVGLSLVFAKDPIANFVRNFGYAGEMDALVNLPAQIGSAEVLGISAMALTGTILATLYPAINAASVDPVLVLRYD